MTSTSTPSRLCLEPAVQHRLENGLVDVGLVSGKCCLIEN